MLKAYIKEPAEKLLLHVYALPGQKIAVTDVEAMGEEAMAAAQALCEESLLESADYACEVIQCSDTEVPFFYPTAYQLTVEGRLQAKFLLQEEEKAKAARAQLKRHKVRQGLKQAGLALWDLVKTILPFLGCA